MLTDLTAVTGGVRRKTRRWFGRSAACALVLALGISPAPAQSNATTIRIGFSVRIEYRILPDFPV